MKKAVIIPARMQATRLPGKPLALLGTKPLILRVYEQAMKATGIDEVAVATDSCEIMNAVESAGGQAVLTRSDHASGSDRVAEAAELIGADLIVNVQGDEPFINPDDISRLMQYLEQKPDSIVTMDYGLSSLEQYQDPNVVKVVKSEAGRALYFSRSAIPYAQDIQNVIGIARGHVGIYGYHSKTLERLTHAPVAVLENLERLEQLRAMSLGIPIWVMNSAAAPIGIDTPEDLEEARLRVNKHGERAFPD
ncbi:MAG: 3-deoxy-manno-octulosonate cytidylyltransferase [Deltaproteobacteria bacterium]|jgi:3-deoxy-manno-octulosonate cytidylyltransferase (CMP-KDO synthetase)|nr:3-deoxy-manno-octulosonate cytidylyltransferase [Deltaproteobacteria bacterium]